MKIKEVIEKTGLTDRAVRLYIDEGLTSPSIEESYNGRKSIDFSDSDVNRLNNIATLRKAGFSIADIKSIIDDSSTTQKIVEKFIEHTKKNILHEKEIVEKLSNISCDREITIEDLCITLSATVESGKVPTEDLKLTPKELIKKIISILLASVLLIYALRWVALLYPGLLDFRYIRLDIEKLPSLLAYSSWLIVIAFSVAILVISTGKRFPKRIRGLISGFFTLSFIATIFSIVSSFLLVFICAFPFYSQTAEAENYLKLDSYLEEYMKTDITLTYRESVFDVFPDYIPLSACGNRKNSEYPDTTKYFYKYTACERFGTYDIYAEWVLSDAEYEKAKKELPDATKITQKGDWTIKYYTYSVRFNDGDHSRESDVEILYEKTQDEFVIDKWKTEEYEAEYEYLLCAYNDSQKKMRYVASGCCHHNPTESGPYHLSLDWE